MLRFVHPPFVVLFFVICLTVNNLSGILDTTDTSFMKTCKYDYLPTCHKLQPFRRYWYHYNTLNLLVHYRCRSFTYTWCLKKKGDWWMLQCLRCYLFDMEPRIFVFNSFENKDPYVRSKYKTIYMQYHEAEKYSFHYQLFCSRHPTVQL